jgi:hypothetical protein
MIEITPEYKTDIQRQIIQAMIEGIESKTFDYRQVHLVANFALEELAKVTTHPQLIAFLEKLTQKWPIFAKVGNTEMGKVIEERKDTLTAEVIQMVKQGDIDTALKTVKEYTTHS